MNGSNKVFHKPIMQVGYGSVAQPPPTIERYKRLHVGYILPHAFRVRVRLTAIRSNLIVQNLLEIA